MWIIIAHEEGADRWRDIGEGPWESEQEAELFGWAEVWAEWQTLEVAAIENMKGEPCDTR